MSKKRSSRAPAPPAKAEPAENPVVSAEAPGAGEDPGAEPPEYRLARRKALLLGAVAAILPLSGSLVALGAALAATRRSLPVGGDFGPFALAAGLSALLLRNRPALLTLVLAGGGAAAGWFAVTGGGHHPLVAALESLALATAAWLAGWRLRAERRRSQSSMSALEATIEELRAISLHDPLTGLYNRRFAFESGKSLIAQVRRYGGDLHVLMLDLDHFKKVNDSLGHATGDCVLKGLAELLALVIRQSDIAARIGGEEFVVILPRTGAEAAYNIANRIRDGLRSKEFPGVPWRITASLGVAGLREEEDFEDILERADFCLYQSKNSGRNRVTVG